MCDVMMSNSVYIPEWLQAGHCDAPPPPFWMTENHFRSHFSIRCHFRSIRNFFIFFSQNGCRWPYWMTENRFRSHFSPFHFRSIRNFIYNFFFQNAAGGHFGSPIWAILDGRKSLSIAF